ncbi:putative efflux protein, MATE family [Peptoclostridium litorale DSM 5388]|uniref:Multidrug export protein MepA n=1 Tax=Peptoclostridium litorale DSM 5388 TaxID=1121324 RepID=A0A069RG21_PEPLI|nr:MATE family efflux transporter [Peptoclostridium litorale]KDR95758.1 multidrug export protein MepA [Peptoclostridium litorale DSM 5388]SIO21907.1 putative efflux protein, MATE family [Peptoclostridium litorale DSM 5388]
MKNENIMDTDNIGKALLKLAIPGIIGMLVNAVYNVVDTIFVGMLQNTSAIAAVSVAFPLFMLISSIGLMYGVGAASYISRLLGQKSREQADKAASTTFFTAIVTGIAFTIAGYFSIEQLLKIFGATPTIMPYAKTYTTIIMLGSVFTIMNMTMNNMIRAEGGAKYSMIALSSGAIINIVLDPVMMFGLDMGINGAAVATVISQAVSTLILLRYYFQGNSVVKVALKNFKPSRHIYSQIMKIGLSTLGRQSLSSVSLGMLNTAAAVYGDVAVAAMGITLRVFSMALFTIFGYNQGMQPLIGYNYGAKRFDRLKKTLGISIKAMTIYSIVCTIVFWAFAEQIVGVFSQDIQVIDIGSRTLRAMCLMTPLLGFQQVYAVLFQALGKGKEAFVLSLSRQGLFFMPAIIVLPKLFGLDGVIFTQTVADFMTNILTAFFAYSISKELGKEEEKYTTKVDEKPVCCAVNQNTAKVLE